MGVFFYLRCDKETGDEHQKQKRTIKQGRVKRTWKVLKDVSDNTERILMMFSTMQGYVCRLTQIISLLVDLS